MCCLEEGKLLEFDEMGEKTCRALGKIGREELCSS